MADSIRELLEVPPEGSPEWSDYQVFGADHARIKADLIARNKADSKLTAIHSRGKWDKVVSQAAAAVAKHPEIYQRNGHLVETLIGEVYGVRNKQPMLRIRELPSPVVEVRISEQCVFLKGKDDDGQPKKEPKPPRGLATAVHALGTWPGSRHLRGIVRTPTIRPDGSILQTPGYDPETGYVYTPSGEFAAVPDEPSHADAVTALAVLREPFEEFEFANPEDALSLHVLIGALVTLISRAAIDGPTPVFGVDASAAGSGKGLAVDVIWAIATGERQCPKITFPGDEPEREKILGSLALAGVQVCCWDNVDIEFGGPAVEKVATSTSPQLRILGKSDAPVMSWNAVTFCTGNQLDIRNDMRRRTLVSRQEPTVERPQERTFRRSDLIGWAIANRERLVIAALTLLRGYFVAGCPATGVKPFGSFTEWRVIAEAIRWAGGPDIVTAQPSRESDPGDEARAQLFTILQGMGEVTAGKLVSLAYDSTDKDGSTVPAAMPALGHVLGALCPTKDGVRPNSRQVGKALARAKGRVFAGLKLASKPSAEGGHALGWHVVDLTAKAF